MQKSWEKIIMCRYLSNTLQFKFCLNIVQGNSYSKAVRANNVGNKYDHTLCQKKHILSGDSNFKRKSLCKHLFVHIRHPSEGAWNTHIPLIY